MPPKRDGSIARNLRAYRKQMTWRVIGAGCVVGVAGWLVSAAAAHNSDITASMNCSGTVSYVATAWAGTTPASRTNADVRVSSSLNGGAQVGAGAFTPANSFSFAGSFAAGSATSVTVTAKEMANWGDGAAPGGPRTVTATRPTNCTPVVPPVTPPVTPPPPVPPVTPPVTPPPPVTPTPPGRAGYCGPDGKFYDLEVGQNTKPPYDQMNLRPADVSSTGAAYCAQATPAAPAAVAPAAPATTKQVAVLGAKKVIAKAKTKAVKKAVPKKKHAGVLAAAQSKTLPFTK
jgi:hypothetical protein